jgi:hypothetical protein
LFDRTTNDLQWRKEHAEWLDAVIGRTWRTGAPENEELIEFLDAVTSGRDSLHGGKPWLEWPDD